MYRVSIHIQYICYVSSIDTYTIHMQGIEYRYIYNTYAMYRVFSKFKFWPIGVFIFSITLFTKLFGKAFSLKASLILLSVCSSSNSVEHSLLALLIRSFFLRLLGIFDLESICNVGLPIYLELCSIYIYMYIYIKFTPCI